MVDKKQLEEVYKKNLENDIINAISEMKGIEMERIMNQKKKSNYRPVGSPRASRFLYPFFIHSQSRKKDWI